MEENFKLKCPMCNSKLKLVEGYTGCDWNCENGKDSGFGWEISLNCLNDKCAYVYTLGHTKELGDFSPVVDKLKPYEV